MLETEVFFAERIKNSAANTTRSTHHIISVSKDIIDRHYTPEATKDLYTRHDTALLISAQFFHTTHDESNIEWR